MTELEEKMHALKSQNESLLRVNEKLTDDVVRLEGQLRDVWEENKLLVVQVEKMRNCSNCGRGPYASFVDDKLEFNPVCEICHGMQKWKMKE